MMTVKTESMPKRGETLGTILALFLAGIPPLIFPVSAAGYASMHILAVKLLLPTVFVLIVLEIFSWQRGWNQLAQSILTGAFAGVAGTFGLELVRETGFRVFHSMPGDLPMLMGVLLTDRIMLGPSFISNLAGWAYHFTNGAAFGIVYLLLFGRRPWWNGLVFGFLVGIGFMTSPVVKSLGVGYFGREFGPGFATTVTLAHLAYGGILGWVASHSSVANSGLISFLVRLASWYKRCFCRGCCGSARILIGLLVFLIGFSFAFSAPKKKPSAPAPAVCHLSLTKALSTAGAPDSISHLMVSNNPESFRETGTLFKEEFPDHSSVRMFYHHQNKGKIPYLFAIDLANHSGDSAKIDILEGSAGPERRELSVGAEAAKRFFLAKKQRQGKTVELHPEHSCSLVIKKVGPGETVSGILELRPSEGTQPIVQVRVFDTKNSDDLMAEKVGNRSSGVFDTPEVNVNSEYVVGGDYTFIPIGIELPLPDRKTGQPHLGNYGVLYAIHLTLKNPTFQPAAVGVMFSPHGGPAKGVFLVDSRLIRTPLVSAYASYPLLTFDLSPGETRSVQIQTMPVGGSFYPVYLVAQPNDAFDSQR